MSETGWTWDTQFQQARIDELHRKYTDAQATIAALQTRIRTATQLIIAEIGASGPEDLEEAVGRVVGQLQQRTSELEAANTLLYKKNCALGRAETSINDLQAELERVRADNKALDEWRADVTVSLQRPGGAFFVDVPQHIKDLVKERDDLRTLLLALPKVEGAVVVSNGYVKDSTRCHALFGADEDAALYAALLQHRQGMEG